jgi:hypothetical protein
VRAQAVGPADGPAATEQAGPRSATFAPVAASGTYTVELSCLGPDQVKVEVTSGENPEPYTDLGSFACTGEVTAKLVDLEAGDRLRVRSDAPASWRVVVEAPPRDPLHATAISDIVVPNGDASLLDVRGESGEPDYAPAGTGGGMWLPADVGWVPHRDQYRVLVSCAGPHSIRYAFTGLVDETKPDELPESHSITEVECNGAVHQDVLDLPLDEARLYVTSSAQIAWHIVMTADPLPIALAPNEGGWVTSSGFGPNWEPDGQASGITGPGEENGGDVRVVVTCSGNATMTGTIDVGPVAGQKLDPFTLDCNGAGTLVRTYPDAASYVEVLYDPNGPGLWVALTIQVRAPASPAP